MIDSLFPKGAIKQARELAGDQDHMAILKKIDRLHSSNLPKLQAIVDEARELLLMGEKDANALVLGTFAAYALQSILANVEGVTEESFIGSLKNLYTAHKYGITDEMILKDQKPS